MNRRKLIALGTVVLLSTIFTRPTVRSALIDGLIGFAEATQRVCEDPCSIFSSSHPSVADSTQLVCSEITNGDQPLISVDDLHR
jgi:hypothetical protein